MNLIIYKMYNKKRTLATLCGIALSCSLFAQKMHTVWFDQPIKATSSVPAWTINSGYGGNPDQNWEQYTLPIGNGSIGANIFGNIEEERITFNEKTLWSGGPNVTDNPSYYWNVNKQSSKYLPQIRQAFIDGDDKLAARLTRDNFNGVASYEKGDESPFRFGSFSTMGEFLIKTESNGPVQNYKRALSLDSAYVNVSYDFKDVSYSRNYFCSYPDRVFVLHFSANQPQKQTLRFSYVAPSNVVGKFKEISQNHIQYVGALKDNNQQFAIDIIGTASNGFLTVNNNEILVDAADDVTFKIVASTDYFMNFNPDFSDGMTYVGEHATIKNDRVIQSFSELSYQELLERHISDYKSLFNRVNLTLNNSLDYVDLPTDRRLERYKSGKSDYYLESLYFQFGRYLLLASSREGSLPANLQGIWHNNIDGPWHVDYHNNIHLQMNYWPVSVTNLNECAKPLFDFIRTLVKPGEVTAKSYFNARGWTASISGNIYGFTAPLSSQDMSWNFNPMAGPWLATHIWDYYDYTRDIEFLKENYDILRASANFAVDYMWKNPQGVFTAAPSTSPEHGPIDQGATFVHAVVKEVLLDAIQASKVLNCDSELTKEWLNVLNNIQPYEIGRYGQLLEWSKDIDDPKDDHRHVNHLFGLHPGRTISPITTPELAEASKVVLEHRGDFATGWSMGWKLNQWARLQDGNHSYTLFQNLLKGGTLPNLWDTHPPFQIDGNFGGTAGIAEMLLQSHMGVIQLLPALPADWSEGQVTGLIARGNFEVDIIWTNNKLDYAQITSNMGGECNLQYGNHKLNFNTQKGKSYKVILKRGKLFLRK